MAHGPEGLRPDDEATAEIGTDFIYDYYAIAEVPRDAEEEELKRALNVRAKEYYPDFQNERAREFYVRALQMTKVLNDARAILLDPDKRRQYDEILEAWNGPISGNGIPILTEARFWERQLRGKTAAEVEAIFGAQERRARQLSGDSSGRVSFLESMIEQMGDQAPEALRVQYEDALLHEDVFLSTMEAERSRLLGLPDIAQQRYQVVPNYARAIAERIDASREEHLETMRLRALGGVGARLALLAGNVSEEAMTPVDVESVALPVYFEDQAERVRAIAAQREGVLNKRLANFAPVYPETELQTAVQSGLAIGIGREDQYVWIGASVDAANREIGQAALPDEVVELLEAQEFAAVIGRGYNVLTFSLLENVDPNVLLDTAVQRYGQKYGLVSDSPSEA